jgi:hypothetical protein
MRVKLPHRILLEKNYFWQSYPIDMTNKIRALEISALLFHLFPQRIAFLHRFCTRNIDFSIEAVRHLPQSAHSACVRCHKRLLEVAAELAVSGNSRG